MTARTPLVPQQQVLVDNTVIVTYVSDAPDDSRKAIVEARGVGPMVLDKDRLQPIV